MKYLILAVFFIGAALSLAAAPTKPPTGTLEVVNQPVYGGDVVLHAIVNRHAVYPNSVVWCGQVMYRPDEPAQFEYVYMNEVWLPHYSSSHLEITFSRGPLDDTHSYIGRHWDASKPAYCAAVVFNDVQGSREPTALTNWASFVVPAAGL